MPVQVTGYVTIIFLPILLRGDHRMSKKRVRSRGGTPAPLPGGTYPKVIGKLKPKEIAARLQPSANLEALESNKTRSPQLSLPRGKAMFSFFSDKKPPVWKYTEHAFGYI